MVHSVVVLCFMQTPKLKRKIPGPIGELAPLKRPFEFSYSDSPSQLDARELPPQLQPHETCFDLGRSKTLVELEGFLQSLQKQG